MFHGVIQNITLAQFFWDTVYRVKKNKGTLDQELANAAV